MRFAHNDYTIDSGPQRVKDLLPDEADYLLKYRFAVINVWRPINHPVQDVPLAVCDASTMEQKDFVATDLVYPDRTGEIYSVKHQNRHRWTHYRTTRRLDPEQRVEKGATRSIPRVSWHFFIDLFLKSGFNWCRIILSRRAVLPIAFLREYS